MEITGSTMNEQKFYIAIDKDDIIWGVGITADDAKKDGEQYTKDEYATNELKTLECTQELHDEVKDNGYCHSDFLGSDDSSLAYWSYSKKRKIAYLPKEKKRANVFETL